MSFGREGAICEYIEIMQILPGSSDDALLINASRVFGNMRRLNSGPRNTHKTRSLEPFRSD
jgi:hypothetical protein